MNLFDRLTDLIVSAWELIGLLFMSGDIDPTVLRRYERAARERDEALKDGSESRSPFHQVHFA